MYKRQPEDIARALGKIAFTREESGDLFTEKDMEEAGLTGRSDSKARREALGEVLGIGYGNGGAFLKKLNRFGITKQQFMEALKKI